MNEKVGISPFLESIKRDGISRSSATVPDRPAAGAGSKISLKLLSMIPVGGSARVAQLLEQSEMDFKDFASALDSIQGAGLVELEGSGSQQAARLTGIGEKLASIV
jgi:hypothetical protein